MSRFKMGSVNATLLDTFGAPCVSYEPYIMFPCVECVDKCYLCHLNGLMACAKVFLRQCQSIQ